MNVVPYRTDYWKNVIEDLLNFSLKAPEWHFPELACETAPLLLRKEQTLKTTQLTEKELRALELKAAGLTLKEIAAATTREPVRQWLAKAQWKLERAALRPEPEPSAPQSSQGNFF